MGRIARVIAEGYPDHVTQRGNRRQRTFFGDDDYDACLDLVAGRCRRSHVAIWAYCLMPNHVHLRRQARTGRPLGDIKFLLRLEGLIDLRLVPGKPGRPPKKGKHYVPQITARSYSWSPVCDRAGFTGVSPRCGTTRGAGRVLRGGRPWPVWRPRRRAA